MTTAEHIQPIAASNKAEVAIAGVPWPRYKVLALLIGVVVAVAVGLFTMAAAPAVVAGAGAGTLVWLVLGGLEHRRA